ncbi:MAG: aminomethyl-transferring glycine dehydrogenase, partial [SAR324 cluster bacterium]|nr:aminomethyl-transferring glycine dehydrogenase [SAR324 cluster bacterium]
MATRDAFTRSVPGRIVGVSVDDRGRTAYRLALQTREQHIRREKATSNICTAQVLLANVAAAYALYHGPEGLNTIARRVHHLTRLLACGLRKNGLDTNATFFDTLTVSVPDAKAVHQRSVAAGMNLRKLDEGRVGISFDETTTAEDVTRLLKVLCPDSTTSSISELSQELEQAGLGIPQGMRRTSEFLTHPVFHEHRSETSMMRYLKRLEGKDIALDRAMIPLGSCTMKLNAATEMRPVTWPEFGRMHPFVPVEQAAGYAELIGGLEDMLCKLTGFDVVCMQPNSGAQGEYAGLLVIRKYHQSRGEGHREVCLIPSSAHGTNPASAAMQGMQVAIVKCDFEGDIDMADLVEKAEEHADRLAALMITYPSTHGVFEPTITEICETIHQHGGQVYMDGANLNALVGIAQPGLYGVDVSHMNLHKTFCIPHGGGGPGMGPIGMKAHLAPFMASHVVVPPQGTDPAQSAISAAPWGSPSILPITWSYIRMMGNSGLKLATQSAILAANYLAKRLGVAFPVLYTGQNERVAHECIIDIRGFRESSGVTEEDVAKRLIDYGIHPPTMYFPLIVEEALMIEPTETESR